MIDNILSLLALVIVATLREFECNFRAKKINSGIAAPPIKKIFDNQNSDSQSSDN